MTFFPRHTIPAYKPFNSDFKVKLDDQIKEYEAAAQKLPPVNQAIGGSWRKGHAESEKQQTFAGFSGVSREIKDSVKIIPFVSVDKTDKKVIEIAAEFLSVFHNIDVEVLDHLFDTEENLKQFLEKEYQKEAEEAKRNFKPQKINGIKIVGVERKAVEYSRKWGAVTQYSAENFIEKMPALVKSRHGEEKLEGSRLIGLTNLETYGAGLNFVFGLAYTSGNGVYSTKFFGNPRESEKAFNLYLSRVLKITTHEFGHQQGLNHCVDYECNMGGYNNLGELNARPLFFCPEDMAKICYLTGTDLPTYAANVKKYLETFNQRHGTNLDFGREINYFSQFSEAEKKPESQSVKKRFSPTKTSAVSQKEQPSRSFFQKLKSRIGKIFNKIKTLILKIFNRV